MFMWMHVHMETRGQPQEPWLKKNRAPPPHFLKHCLSLAWNQLTRLGWLASVRFSSLLTWHWDYKDMHYAHLF